MQHPLITLMLGIRNRDRQIHLWLEQREFYLELEFKTMEVLENHMDGASARTINEYKSKLATQQKNIRDFDTKISDRIQILLDRQSTINENNKNK